MKKTLMLLLVLLVTVCLFAEIPHQKSFKNTFSGRSQSRTEVIYWQETFEDGAPGWTFSPATTANLWHIAPVNDAPSPVNAMVNQNDQGTYNPNMMNYLYSPSITLPLSGAIRADFMMKGDFNDPSPTSGGLSVLDYWGWEISPNNGTTWYRMSNPYNSPTGMNYVFIDAPTNWEFVTTVYNGLDGFISDYAGYTVKFRIYFRSDSDTPDGPGIMVDNFTIFNDVFLPPPMDLAASTVGQTVALNWTAPLSGFTTETITSTNSAWTAFVSDADAFAMKITNPFNDPLPLYGVKFMLYRQNSAPISGNPTVHVYTDMGGLPGIEVATVTGVANMNNMEWKLVDVSSYNVIIPASGSVFVGISNIDEGGTGTSQGLLCDSTSVSVNSYALFQGSWEPLNQAYNGLKNCALGGVYLIDDPFAPILTGFKVYRTTNINSPFTHIGTITNPSTVNFIDETPVIGQVNYYQITGLFDVYESEPSNTVSIDLIGLLYTEVLIDDGTSDQNYNVGVTNSFCTKFVTNPMAEIHYAKVYLNTVGGSPLIIRIFDDNGDGGLPGTQLLQFTAAITNLTPGWNNLAVPTANIVTDINGIFYIGLYEYASVSTFGLDTSASGSSFKKIGTAGAWTPITEGNVMIRALVTWQNSNDDMIELPQITNLSNYPNPFVQNTEISFDLSKAGKADLKIYNLKGQLVRILSSGNLNKGSHKLIWDGMDKNGSRASVGMYFARLEMEGKTLTHKLIRIK